MKKTLMVLVAIVLVSALGTAYADESAAMKRDAMSDPDSLINSLDPANAPKPAVSGQRGMDGSTAGLAAVVSRENADSLINYLDPSNAPKAKIVTITASAGSRENPDSLINDLDPSNAPKAGIATKVGKAIMR